MRDVHLGKVAGLELHGTTWLFVTFPFMWALFSGIGVFFFHAGPKTTILGGLLLAVAHIGADVFHQMGHARAARGVQHPMIGVKILGPIGTSIYPVDEGELTPEQHLKRAWGGIPASLLLTVAAFFLTWLLIVAWPHHAWVPFVFFLDCLFFYTLGAFMPLGFTDGSSIIHWTRKRAQLKES